MSLNSIINSGVSALMVNQTAMRVTSNNVSNVNTEGYARKVIDQSSVILDGVGVGVQVEQVRRIADEFLLKELRNATSDAERFSAMSQIHEQLQSWLGDPATNQSISGKLDIVFSSLAALPTDPTSNVGRLALINDLQNLGEEFGRLAEQIQVLRIEADRQVGGDVEAVNTAIATIYKLNQEISLATQRGLETGSLIDLRDQAIQDIAKIMDVKTFPLRDGAVAVTTATGLQLVDQAEHRLVYSSGGTASSEETFAQITVNRVDPISGDLEPTGLPLDPALQSGSLRGWLDMRNTELPNLATQIGALAAAVTDQLNRVHNDNVAVPPPATLTGHNSGLAGTDPHGFTGIATFYAFDATNNVASSVTIDFGTVATINDVVAAVNAGLGGNGTLSIAGGVMSFAAAGGATGVGIAQDATTPSDRAGRGFSHFFGMNDLVEARVAPHFDTGFAAGDAHSTTGVTSFQLVGPNNETPISFDLDFGAIGGTYGAAVAALNTGMAPYMSFALNADGALVATPAAGYEDYRLTVPSDTTDRAGTGVTFGEMFGLGPRFPADAALDFQVRADIQKNPKLIALADVDPLGTPALTESDGRGALQFQELAQADFTFPAVGGLAAVSGSLSEFSSQIMAKIGLEAARADALEGDRRALQTELNLRNGAVSEVNMDEELSNLIVYQNAYNAAARLITTAREMYDTLLQL